VVSIIALRAVRKIVGLGGAVDADVAVLVIQLEHRDHPVVGLIDLHRIVPGTDQCRPRHALHQADRNGRIGIGTMIVG
jgi:hypothetical protein